MSGVSLYGNVVVGYQTGIFFHFGRANNASGNLFIGCNASVWCEGCYAIPRDKWCNLPFDDPDPGDTMIAALHDAMAWPAWNTTWLAAYPLLANVSWNPGATVNNTVNANVALGRGLRPAAGDAPPPQQFRLPKNHSAVLPPTGNWNQTALTAAQFVAADPVAARDFTLQPGSPVFAATAGGFRQIPGGQGPRPQQPPF